MTPLPVLTLAAMLQTSGISGAIPSELGSLQPPGRVVWLDAGAQDGSSSERKECLLTTATRWYCPAVDPGQRGVVIIFGETLIAFVIASPAGVTAAGAAPWGRLVRVNGPQADGEAGEIELSAWALDRPASRPNTLKLDAVPDTSLRVLRLSNTAFWIHGPLPSDDQFLTIGGAGVGRRNIGTATIAAEPPDIPFAIDAGPPVSVRGRVEARSGEPAEGALVELAVKANTDDRRNPVVRFATIIADADGQFEFPGLSDGLYQVTATAFASGRLTEWTTTSDPPLLMKLAPPANVKGRVLARKLAAPEVKVRFVPETNAWRGSVDASVHLTADTHTDEAGRFILALPPEHTGAVQFIASDGSSLRVALPSDPNLNEISLGDVVLPQLIAVDVQADVAGCRMSAIGPTGSLGMAIVSARASSTLYQFELPEPGQWFLDAECSGDHVSLQPAIIHVTVSSSLFDVHVMANTNSPR